MVRYRAIFFAMLNLAISMVFFTLLSKLYHLTGGTDGMRVATPTLLGVELDRRHLRFGTALCRARPDGGRGAARSTAI